MGVVFALRHQHLELITRDVTRQIETEAITFWAENGLRLSWRSRIIKTSMRSLRSRRPATLSRSIA
jgi:hypothetical protein